MEVVSVDQLDPISRLRWDEIEKGMTQEGPAADVVDLNLIACGFFRFVADKSPEVRLWAWESFRWGQNHGYNGEPRRIMILQNSTEDED